MQCRSCAAENPAQNRFCGMCGTALERRAKLQPNGYFSDRHGAEPVLKQEFSAPDSGQVLLDEEAASVPIMAKAPAVALVEEPLADTRPPIAVKEAPVRPAPVSQVPVEQIPVQQHPIQAAPVQQIPVQQVPVQQIPAPLPVQPSPAAREYQPATAASSILGLSGDFAPLYSSETGGDGSYLLSDAAPERTVSWRAWALLLVLVALAGLGWTQWYASHYHRRPDLARILERGDKEQPKEAAPTAADKQQSPPESGANSPEQPQDKRQEKGAAPAAAAATPTPAPASTTTTTPPATTASTSSAPSTPASSQSKDVAAATKGTVLPIAEKPVPKKVADAAPAPKYGQDPMLLRAQQYIHARPQNCELGMNYLKAAAETNPAARIQMAALYQSGVCVRMDRAQAYHWFSLAQQLDPHNMWLEKSRSQLWANMTPAERAKAQ